MSPRAHGNGVRKVCRHGWRAWPKCPCAWYFSFKPRGSGRRFRFSLDAELGQHCESKTDAEKAANTIREAILAGTFERVADRLAREQRKAEARTAARQTADPAAPLTIEALGEAYFADYINPKTGERLSASERLRWDLVMRTEIQRPNVARLRFGALPVTNVNRHDIDAFRKAHLEPRTVTVKNVKGHTYAARRGGIAGVRGCLGRLRAFFSWAVEHDQVPTSPFRKGGQAVQGLFITEPGRERRLDTGEWERLFAAANPHLQALMTAAIETGCRVGELLSLQWQSVRFDLNEIHLRAKDTKARRVRDLPMSQRLRGLLEMRRIQQDGKEFPPTAFVFGDATGAHIKSVKTAWDTARLKAHGYEVKREANGRLTAACRDALRAINLRFHDLRREAGSRFLEGGMAANYVQKFLDHAKLSTTSRYLNVNRDGMHAALKRFEDTREVEETRAAEGDQASGGKTVAKPDAAGDQPNTEQGSKLLQ